MTDNAPRPSWQYVLFASVTWLSALLLFLVQPLMGRAVLPWFGGAPAVWTTAMLFFQLVLLAGYAYAHWLSVRLPERAQVALHVAIVLLACCALPIAVDPSWKPTLGAEPTARIVMLLLATVGAPYFVLSTTGPLLQRWMNDVLPTRSPYGLYALSNFASLLALLSYPVVFERALSTHGQAWAWSLAFAVLACGIAACGLLRWRVSARAAAVVSASIDAPPPSIKRRVAWLCLALVPSWMLLSITNELCIDVASVPFLWVVPLTIYLASFVLCFARSSLYRRAPWVVVWLLSSTGICAHLIDPTGLALWIQVCVYLAALMACAMLCHGELSRSRPAPEHLTSFYLSLSLGGALGGIFVGAIAPRVFNDYFELHLGVVACYVAVLACFIPERADRAVRLPTLLSAFGLGLTCLGLLAAISLSGGADGVSGRTILQSRSFYGVLRVAEAEGGRVLTHGRIWHGMQLTDPARRKQPTLYYGAQSGIVRLLASIETQPRRVGIAGLGVGTLALYGRSGDQFRIYEIDPAVIAVANTHFTFLADSDARIEMVEGDARISLEREPPNHFDVLVLDAFSSDSVPAHLLTIEAFEVYLRHLGPRGVLAFHVSNRYLDLVPMLAGNSQQLGLAYRVHRTEADYERLLSASTWVFVARQESRLAAWPKANVEHRLVWTDARSSLFDVLR